MTEAMNAFSISQGLAEGLSHRNADVFVGVVVIDVGITYRSNRQID
ncbi:enoyl-(acyl carrier protein) reductase [Synechococcus sp. BL107]|nr:enoyl-(acyl carrier protein) reductase [Synechococcus sp. BL107]